MIFLALEPQKVSVGQRGICSGVKAISEDGQIQGSSTQVALAQVQHRPVTIGEQCKGGKMVHEPIVSSCFELRAALFAD